jgi:hypothetical protein
MHQRSVPEQTSQSDVAAALGRAVARRTLLQAGAGVALAAAAYEVGLLPEQAALRLSASGLTPTATLAVVRREDMLAADLLFYNLMLIADDNGENPRLVRKQPGAAYVVIVLAPQSLVEAASLEKDNVLHIPTPPVPAFLAAPTQLGFQVRDAVSEIPYDLTHLLDLASLSLQVVPGADTPDGTRQTPDQTMTRLELPWHLLLSPGSAATFAAATGPVTRGTRTELWHARLAKLDATTRRADEDGPVPTVRAVDYVEAEPAWPDASTQFTALTFPNRQNLAKHGISTNPKETVPVPVARLHVSPLGGALDVHAAWDVTGNPLVEWKHILTLGRDQYVRVVNAGFLFPLGHQAALVEITERKVAGGLAALYKKMFVVVRQPVRDFTGGPDARGELFQGRQNPFRQIRLLTPRSPDLDLTNPGSHLIATLPILDPGNQKPFGFWIDAAPFSVEATDWEGHLAHFKLPLAFLSLGLAQSDPNTGPLKDILTAYQLDTVRRSLDLGGQKIALAPTTGAAAGSTTSPVGVFKFVANPSSDVAASPEENRPSFHPAMFESSIRVPAAEAIAGGSLQGSASPTMRFHSVYLDNGFDADTPSPKNLGSTYLLLHGQAARLDVTTRADKSGGIASPSLDIQGLSRHHGPVGGNLSNFASGVFDPADYFGALKTKLLGTIDLFDVVKPPALIDPIADGTDVPRLLTTTDYPGGDTTKPPEKVHTHLTWAPDLKTVSVFEPFNDTTPAALSLVVDTTLDLKTQAATSRTEGTLTDFTINLFADFPALTLRFNRLHFVSVNGGTPHVDLEIENVKFEGALSFVNVLQDFVSALGVPGLSIDVQPTGVDAGYTLGLPAITVGVFSLTNVTLNASFHLPFDNSPARFRFGFCSSDHPFLLTVSIFGGGGWCVIGLGTDGLELVDAGLQFGAALALDIGVASGSVSVMAGVQFVLTRTPDPHNPAKHVEKVALTGFLRIDGNLTVLGIVSISAQFYMSLSYLEPGKVEGRASMSVSISIGPFSVSVSLEVERRFGGSGDPFFGDCISRGDWSTYCDAFALEGA